MLKNKAGAVTALTIAYNIPSCPWYGDLCPQRNGKHNCVYPIHHLLTSKRIIYDYGQWGHSEDTHMHTYVEDLILGIIAT